MVRNVVSLSVIFTALLYSVYSLPVGYELTDSDAEKLAKALPKIQTMYASYGILEGEGDEDYIRMSDTDITQKLVAKIQRTGVYDDMSRQVKGFGFNSIEHFLNIHQRVVLGVGRVSLEQEYGQSLETFIEEQNHSLASLERASPEALFIMQQTMNEILDMSKVMMTISEEELSIVKKHKESFSHLLERS